MNRDNHISSRSSTRVHQRPGGNSSFSLGWNPAKRAKNDLNAASGGNAGAAQGKPMQSMQAAGVARGQRVTNVMGQPMRTNNVVRQAPPMTNVMGQKMMGQAMGRQQAMGGQRMMMQPQQAAAAGACKAPKSDATDVKAFTHACDQPCSPRPALMSREEVEFITKMILDELLELNATVLDPRAAKNMMTRLIGNAKDVPRVQGDEANLIAEQGDAFVDIWYYSLNAACKKGVNLSSIFQLVHAANMAKIDPRTGKCIKRQDGKIMKPQGWQPPNVRGEILRQKQSGGF